MTTLRERFNSLLKPECVAGEYTMYQAAQMALIAKQMDALLEECYESLQCPVRSQEMFEKIKKEGYGE